MGLIDHRILMSGGNPLADGIQQGQGIRQNWQQGQDQGRTRAAAQAFQQAAQGKDITTAEGMGQAIQGMVQAGFADEGRRVFEAHKELFQKEKPQATEYDFREGGDGLYATPKNNPTQATKVQGFMPKATETKPKKYQPVKNKVGKIVGWDAETGLGMDGKPVEFWQEPNNPKPDGIKPEHIFSMEQKLANDFKGLAANSIGVATANAKIGEALQQNNPLDAYNAIVQFVKIIDPGTAAREGEVQSAVLSASGGVGEKLAQAARKAYNGTLDAETAKNIRESAAALVRGEKKTFESHKNNFKGKINSYNVRGYKLDEKAILGEYDSLFNDPAPAPGKADPKSITKPDEEDEYQAWKKSQGG